MNWTADRVDLLKRLWVDGFSASQIAVELGGITRNAVIGKVHRLGLGNRVRPPQALAPVLPPRRLSLAPLASIAAATIADAVQTATAAVMSQAVSAPRAAPGPTRAIVGSAALAMEPRPTPVAPPLSAPTEKVRMTILTLTESSCKWPIGDPTAEDFHFCGRRSVTGMPYCGHHSRLAYQPAVERRRDRPAGGGRA